MLDLGAVASADGSRRPSISYIAFFYVKIFPAGLDGNDSRRIWQGLAGPRERKDPSGVRSQNLPKRILGYELSLTSQRPYVRWSICPLGAPGAAGRLEQSGAG